MGHPKPKQILKSSKVATLGLLESLGALAYLCVKYTRCASKKLLHGSFKHGSNKQLMTINKRRNNKEVKMREFGEESFGEGGLWRKSILMGDKCEPLDFSGVIYYDCNGNRLSEAPMKSPRASPLVGYDYRA